MSDGGYAFLVGALVFAAFLLIPLLVAYIVRCEKRKSESARVPKAEDPLFPIDFDAPDSEQPVPDPIDRTDVFDIYEYESGDHPFRLCLYCGVENDTSSDRCRVCGNKLN